MRLATAGPLILAVSLSLACGCAERGSATFTLAGDGFTIGAWGRDVHFDAPAIVRAARLDSAGRLYAPLPFVRSGRLLNARAVGDTIFALVTITGPSVMSAGSIPCSSTTRESLIAWIRIPRSGAQPAPRTVRYESCWENTTHTGLHDTGDSIWVSLSSASRGRTARAAYDARHPELGIAFQESLIPTTVIAAGASVVDSGVSVRDSLQKAAQDSLVHLQDSLAHLDDLEDAERRRAASPMPVLRDPGLLTYLAAAIRDTLETRGCRVPQYMGDTSANVVRGNFLGSGEDTWAIWCVMGAGSRILIFRDGVASPRGELQLQVASPPDETAKYDSTAPSGQGYGCIGSIFRVEGRATEPVLRQGMLAGGDSIPATERSGPVHDSIGDGECEGVSNLHYWTGTRWIVLPGGD